VRKRDIRAIKIPSTLIPEVVSHEVMFLNISGMDVFGSGDPVKRNYSPMKRELHLALFCFSDGFLQPVECIGRLLS
jgi:hypothetical protein